MGSSKSRKECKQPRRKLRIVQCLRELTWNRNAHSENLGKLEYPSAWGGRGSEEDSCNSSEGGNCHRKSLWHQDLVYLPKHGHRGKCTCSLCSKKRNNRFNHIQKQRSLIRGYYSLASKEESSKSIPRIKIGHLPFSEYHERE